LTYTIQANGQLRCLGSSQHLKSKFGKGYQLEVKVQHANRGDNDYQQNMATILERYNVGEVSSFSLPDNTSITVEDDIDPENKLSNTDVYLNVEEAKFAVEFLTNDDSLSSMITASDPNGFSIWKEASCSPTGIHISTLVLFATSELRMRQLDRFINQTFPKHVLRERQDTKARYEIECDGMKISSIFANIEQNKDKLQLSDYSVSQTSLEQVFNMHAAEAERYKVHKIDG
jgi:ATP-binding cassette, subfamily A (ABC1), member 3